MEINEFAAKAVADAIKHVCDPMPATIEGLRYDLAQANKRCNKVILENVDLRDRLDEHAAQSRRSPLVDCGQETSEEK